MFYLFYLFFCVLFFLVGTAVGAGDVCFIFFGGDGSGRRVFYFFLMGAA
jgi:hypothetical protein